MAVYRQMKKAAVRVGLEPNKISPHKFRHSSAYYYLVSDLGKSFTDKFILASSCLGHSSFKSTETYVRIPPTLITTIINKHQEAEKIFEETYLSELKSIEARGHRL